MCWVEIISSISLSKITRNLCVFNFKIMYRHKLKVSLTVFRHILFFSALKNVFYYQICIKKNIVLELLKLKIVKFCMYTVWPRFYIVSNYINKSRHTVSFHHFSKFVFSFGISLLKFDFFILERETESLVIWHVVSFNIQCSKLHYGHGTYIRW